MDLVSLLIVLIVIGLVIYLVKLLPLDGTIKIIIECIVVLILIIYLLSLVGATHLYLR